MKIFKKAALGAMLLGAFAVTADDICDDMFKTADSLKAWGNPSVMTFLPGGGPESDENAVKITSTDATKVVTATFRVDLNKVKGKTIELTAKVKGEDISKPDKPYLGIKMMLVVTGADGKIQYNDTSRHIGTFDWQKLKTVAKVPADAKAVLIQIGLQNSTGSIYFADLELDTVD